MDTDRDALHAFFIACSYGMTALAVIIEIIALRRRRRRALQTVAAYAATAAATDSQPARDPRTNNEITA